MSPEMLAALAKVLDPRMLLTLLNGIREIAAGKRLDPQVLGEIQATILELEEKLK